MAQIKNGVILDFLVTFFVGEQICSRMLTDILKNRNSHVYLEALGLPSDFDIPFFQEDGGIYTLRKHISDQYEETLNGDSSGTHVINSGDYFSFKSKNSGRTVKILFIATSDIEIGYKKIRLPKDTNIFIGRTLDNDISYGFSDFVSREKHAVIRTDRDGNTFIEDLKQSIGIYVNGHIVQLKQLKNFDEIFIMGMSIVYMGDFIAVRNLKMESNLPAKQSFIAKIPDGDTAEEKYFVSTPRILKSLDCDEIEIDAPPSPFTVDKTPFILTFGPSFTMSIVMMASLGVSIVNAINGGEISTIVASSTMAVGMLMGSLMWPSLLRRYQKKCILAEERHRKDRYTSYIAGIENNLLDKRERTVRLLNDSFCPSPEILSSMLDNESNKLRLWERSYEDDDFLSIRLGLGSRAFQVHLKIPRQGFQLHEDELCNLPVELSDKYSILNQVPLTLDIRSNHTIGIIGTRKNIYIILVETILNIISLHPCDEVKIALIMSPKRSQAFEVFKNVPHIWSNDKRVRFFATNSDEVHYIFKAIDEAIRERENSDDKVSEPIPHYIIIVTDPDLIEKEALLRYMNDADNQVGLTTLFAYGDITKLPKTCKTIIQSDNTRTGYYIKNKNANKFIPFTLDDIDIKRVYRFAGMLSHLPIKRDSRVLGIAERISFLQMYKAGNVKELDIDNHWDNNNSAKSLAAPIGVMAGGEIFSLDIHEAYHGCHGLVAGTTGSGKSEFLQAFVLSLAINYSPKEIAFVLVDFKGGDMARPFMKKPFAPALPHLSATISNLSGNILYRALVSLEAEIKSRQRIFNESAAILGVDKLDINSYHRYYKGGRLNTPLPHLVIIIDEFAQLKTQQPEFLTQLINVAQVGRSLGIHLILATQKPNGIVDPQIMSNSRFRVCLKVADKQDSIDMIGKPDAAMIKNPGRLYLQVGYDEIYECVQSGYSGADYVPLKTYIPDEEITVQMTDNTANPIHSAKIDLSYGKTDKTQLEAIVSEIVALGQKKGISAKPLWLDELPEKAFLDTLESGEKGLCTSMIGLVDFVRTQEQKPLVIDFTKTGHVALYGASGTGKTTFLQTLIYSMICKYCYTPEELNIYAVDFGGRNLGYLSALPHTGGVVFADDEDKLSELARMLHDIVEERKRIFADNNCGTFVDYHILSKTSLPAILILIDNFASFRDKYIDISDSFIDIISCGETFGIYFVITGSTRNSIYYKATEYISTYFTLKMNDPSNYMDIHNMRPSVVPEDISGRGITVINREVVEFQTALAFEGETEADRISFINQKYCSVAAEWHGYLPVRLDAGAEELTDFFDTTTRYYPTEQRNNPPESISDNYRNLILGTSKTGALTYGISLGEDYKTCICANDIEQLEKIYRIILENSIQYSNRRFLFIDDDRGTFMNLIDEYPECRYIQGAAAFDHLIEELKPELNSRLELSGKQQDQIVVVISEFSRFFDMITDDQAAFMRKVCQYIDSPKYDIDFVCGFNINEAKNNDKLFMSLIVNAENYVLCPKCYQKASEKIETLPVISNLKLGSCYLCLKEKYIELRW